MGDKWKDPSFLNFVQTTLSDTTEDFFSADNQKANNFDSFFNTEPSSGSIPVDQKSISIAPTVDNANNNQQPPIDFFSISSTTQPASQPSPSKQVDFFAEAPSFPATFQSQSESFSFDDAFKSMVPASQPQPSESLKNDSIESEIEKLKRKENKRKALEEEIRRMNEENERLKKELMLIFSLLLISF